MLNILKASAGSGKTYRLARKYIELLLESNDRFAYRHILAVTFTNKATDEMKSRILKELYILSTRPAESGYHDYFVPSVFRNDQDLQQKAGTVLSDILHDYSAFAVSTIDRFFQQALKAFSREIGQFNQYQIEMDRGALVTESVDRILDSLTEEETDLLSWLTDNVLEQIEQGRKYKLDAGLSSLAQRLMSSQRNEALENAGLDRDMEYPMEKLMAIRSECRSIIQNFPGEVRDKAKAVLDVLVQTGVAPEDFKKTFLNPLYKYASLEDEEPIKALTDSYIAMAGDSEQWLLKSKRHLLPMVYPAMQSPIEDFCYLLDKGLKVYNTAKILDDQLYGLGVAGELDRAFKELMKEKNVLCLDDSNTILRDIIDGSDAPFVYEKLGVRYDNFLLDEFQDTSNVQWDNFKPLLLESESKGGENLIVGDVKQSIYRWRGSDWKLLNDTIPGEFPEHRREVLDTNFRSLLNVVKFNNLFFKAAAEVLDGMNDGSFGSLLSIYSDVGQKTRDEKAAESGREIRCRPAGNVSMTFCDAEEELPKVLEAVREVVSRGAKLSEIAVLVRKNIFGEEVALYLLNNGIPVITDDSLRVKSSITVRRLISLMSFADNPDDTVNGYLARSLNVRMPESCNSLIDMVEALFRELKKGDSEGLWREEAQHIQSLMDNILSYVSKNGNNLRGFLKWWEDENPSISSPSSGDSVRIITIHKAKGLDFPYVIMPFVEKIEVFSSRGEDIWCVPDLEGTPLENVAEGVYDVKLSSKSLNDLFAEDYKREHFLQMADNTNTVYVAMTRAVNGMHLIAKAPKPNFMEEVDNGKRSKFSDFSQILYWFASVSARTNDIPGNEELLPPFKVNKTICEAVEEENIKASVRFDVGEIVDFSQVRENNRAMLETFELKTPDELPSYPLNGGPAEEEAAERGRLRLSADSADFFSGEGEAGIAASNRIKGVVLHDILSRIERPGDLHGAVQQSLMSGDLTPREAEEAEKLLSERISSAAGRGWFPESADRILNESTIIDGDGGMHRPDRVVVDGGRVIIIDYKFGEHHKSYERQLKKYVGLWRRMGYDNVSAFLWYVHTDEVRTILE